MEYWIIHAQENPAAPRDEPGRRQWRSNMLAETFADRGHDVVRWRSAFSHQAKEFLALGNVAQQHENYTQRFLACPAYRRHIGLSRILNHLALGRSFSSVSNSMPRPDLIHVGNVPIALAYAAVRYGKRVGCPVVVDIRDLWPDIYADLLPSSMSGLRHVVIASLHALSFRLKWTMRNATAITALTQPYMDWALALAGRAQTSDDAVFAMCYPSQKREPAAADLDALRVRLGLTPQDQVAVYLGNIGHQSDFESVISAARALSDQFPNFKLVLAGSGPRENELRRLAADATNVIFSGWLQGPEIVSLLHLAQIGLIAFHPVPNYLLNIPNKFSEYLAGGLAIACGLGGEMGALVEEFGCGFQYPPGDASALKIGLAQLLSNPTTLDEMGVQARALHARSFDGAQVYPAFADHLERVAKTSQGHSRP